MSYCVVTVTVCKLFYSSLSYLPLPPISCLLRNQLAPAESTAVNTEEFAGIMKRCRKNGGETPICNNYNLIDRHKNKERQGENKRRMWAPLRSGVARCILRLTGHFFLLAAVTATISACQPPPPPSVLHALNKRSENAQTKTRPRGT